MDGIKGSKASADPLQPLPPSLTHSLTLGHKASSSSKNITQGALALALENTWRTLDSLSPTYMLSNSGPFTL